MSDAERKKTTILIPRELSRNVEIWAKRLGCGKNGFVAVSLGLMLAELSKIESRQKRLKLLRDVDDAIQRVLTKAREAA